MNENAIASTRWSLIRKLKNLDDQESWSTFFETYWRLIYSVAVRSGCNHAEAEDIVQETVISVCKHMATFQADPSQGSFKSWLLQMTRWRVIDLGRRKQLAAGRHVDQPDDGRSTRLEDRVPDVSGQTFEAIWEDGWKEHIVDAALLEVKRQSSGEHFQMFHLMLKKGKTAQEVADMLHVPVDRVYVVKHRLAKLMETTICELERDRS